MTAATNHRSRSKFSLLKSKRWIFLAFATALSWILTESNSIALGAEVATPAASDEPEKLGLEPIELTSKDFAGIVGIGDGMVWLIEFYTPSCKYCVQFEPSYKAIAQQFHSDPDKNIRVARVNCNAEKALSTRFGIHQYPSFFIVTGWDVYELDGAYSVTSLIEAAKGGYEKKKPISFMNSPMGPLGLLQGALIFGGSRAMEFLEHLNETYNISPMFAGVIICILGVSCGMISIILLALVSIPRGGREKID